MKENVHVRVLACFVAWLGEMISKVVNNLLILANPSPDLFYQYVLVIVLFFVFFGFFL